MLSKRRQRDALIDFARGLTVAPSEVNGWFEQLGISPLRQGTRLYDLILRPQLTVATLAGHIPALASFIDREIEQCRREEIIEATEILIKYKGYIDREQLIAEKIRRLDTRLLTMVRLSWFMV